MSSPVRPFLRIRLSWRGRVPGGDATAATATSTPSTHAAASASAAADLAVEAWIGDPGRQRGKLKRGIGLPAASVPSRRPFIVTPCRLAPKASMVLDESPSENETWRWLGQKVDGSTGRDLLSRNAKSNAPGVRMPSSTEINRAA